MTTLSLELAKELQQICKEKNIPMPESRFYWHYNAFCHYVVVENCSPFPKSLPAYTLDELLEWLPEYIYEGLTYELLRFKKKENGYDAYYEYNSQFNCYSDPNPCDACGKLLIWLLKEGLI